jgi:hypothetical protein
MAIRLNNVEKTTLAFPSNTIKSYSLYFEKGGQYTLDVLVQELSVSYTH